MDFLIDDEPQSAPAPRDPAMTPWRLLIVDDAQDVHDATRFALRDFVFEGRGVDLLHAATAAEARDILQREDDIALAIVDVVMESEQAGIGLIDWMRNTLGNRLTRVILRTGQPGYAPESSVILQHEIDGYQEKSEMTRTRLTTMLVTALRGYRQLRALERHEAGLHQLVDGLGDLLDTRHVPGYAESLINQLAALFGAPPEGFVCATELDSPSHDPANLTLEDLTVLSASGPYADLPGECAADRIDAAARSVLQSCLAAREPVVSDGYACVFLHTSAGLCGLVLVSLPADTVEPSNARELLRLFSINASVGYQNARLFEHVHNLAYTDANTGLPNFTAFAEIFEDYCTDHPDEPAAVVLFDVQRYRVIEHGIGPEHALKALHAAGARLRNGLPDAPVVAHRRGDEFALMVVGEQVYRPEAVVSRIEGLFESPLRVGEVVFTLRPRLALAHREGPGDDAQTLARRAGVALDELRRSGSGAGRYRVYDERMNQDAYERLRIATLLSGDDKRQLCHVYCQPILDSATEAVVAGEALLRFIQPDGTTLHTGNAVAAAEASGLILDLGRWAIEQGLRQHRELLDQGHKVRLNVNLSPAQIHSNQVTRVFAEIFERTGFDPRYLNIEVTEGLFMEGDAQSVSFLQWLRDQGARILIDDFGTGYSSLAYLRKLPVDGLKIDRSFVMDMVDDLDCTAVIGSIVGVAKALGLELTAEGVETVGQRDALRDMGIEKLQGFLYSKALPKADFADYATKGGGRSAS
jgi:EAL domain-containing protein (putative c-di-GMP-specific phosphodiesterase class I)/PleD family two-component response regulator